jgi:hypothetical protein
MAHDPEVRAQAMRERVAIDRAESEGEMTDHAATDHAATDHAATDHAATDHAQREDAKSSRKSVSTPLQGEMQFLKP